MATHKKPGKWRARTQAVRGGQMRTPFQETAEALFLTSGYAYEAPEEAEARFKGEAEGFVYSRYSNPTVAMFEARMAALEGAPCARATASGMAAVTAAFLAGFKQGDHVVAAQGDVRRLPLCDRGNPAALRDQPHAGRRHRRRPVAERA